MEEDEVVLSSSESMIISLEAIRQGRAGLSSHRKQLLIKVPKTGDWTILPTGSVTIYAKIRKIEACCAYAS